jgi:GNAT superfamily N-acetyltransferase
MPDGARGCWCAYWSIGANYRDRSPEANRQDLRTLVQIGPPPGLIAFDGETPVGWVRIAPRSALPQLAKEWRLRSPDGAQTWSITCLYVRKGFRRRGVTAGLIQAAVEAARAAGAPAVEGYPFDRGVSPSATGTGVATTYAKLGFVEIARHAPARPIVRLRLN